MATILTQGQRRFLEALLGLALFVLANSAYLFLSDGGESLPVFYQLMLIGHLVGGIVLLVMATWFLVWHLGRVKRLLHMAAVTSGAGMTLAMYLLFATGLFIMSEAKSREHLWIFRSHQVLALLAPLGYAVHRLVSHFQPRRRPTVFGAAAFAAMLLGMLAAHGLTLPETKPVPRTMETRADPFVPFRPTNFPDPSSPFFPANTTTSSGGFFPARIITKGERGDFARIREDIERLGFASTVTIGAETCRRCHADIVAQWEASAHRFSSFNNPFYRASVDRLRETAGYQASQFCAGCHDPAIMLAGNMTKDIDPLVPESQAGLTCLACHAIDAIHGAEGNGNFNVADETPSPYVGDDASDGWQRFLADQMIKSKPGAHKRQLLKPFFRTAEYCLTCHKVSLDKQLNDYRYIRGQDEYDNWHDSGVSLNAARTFYLPKAARACQDCHMPPEDAPLGDLAAKDGKVRSHRFLAVNTALPYIRGDFKSIERIEAFLKNEKVRIDIFALSYPDGKMVRALDRARPYLVPGEEVVFDVVVRNKGVGHTFPGGTNDSNQAWIDFRITGEDGENLYSIGAIDERGRVDERAHFYRVIMVRHDGSEADERDAHMFHVTAFSRVIGPGAADVARFAFKVPEGLGGRRVRIEARLQWRKFNRRYTEFVFVERGLKVPDLPHLAGQRVPELPVTTIAQDRIELDVRERRAAAARVDDARAWERYNDHGIANFLQGAFDVAEASWAEVARLRPDLPDGPRNLARRWIASAAPEKAEPYLRRVDEVTPLDPQRPYFWGRYFERIEEYEQAQKAYEASLEVFPGDRDGWRRLGAVRYKLHLYAESLQAYLKVLEIDPEDVEAHSRRLDIYRQLGDREAAEEARKAFLKYKRDEEALEVARRFLLEHKEINHDAQPRHVHR